MAVAALSLGVWICAAAAAQLAFVPEATVTSSIVTLGDVADLSALPPVLRRRAGALELARLKPREAGLDVSARRLAERARAGLPALGPWLADPPAGSVSIRLTKAMAGAGAGAGDLSSAPRPRLGPASCLRVLAHIAAGVTPTQAEVASAPCTADARGRALRFDARLGVVRASADLAAGDLVDGASTAAIAVVRRGQRLRLQSRQGPVVVERSVEVAWPARRGERVYVRAADGVVFSVPAPQVGS